MLREETPLDHGKKFTIFALVILSTQAERTLEYCLLVLGMCVAVSLSHSHKASAFYALTLALMAATAQTGHTILTLVAALSAAAAMFSDHAHSKSVRAQKEATKSAGTQKAPP